MPPKRKAKISAPLPAISPRKTRSATAVKRAETPAVAPARVRAPSKKAKLSTAGNAEDTDGAKEKADLVKAKDDVSSDAEALAAPPHAAAASVGAAKTIIIEACKQCTSFKTRAVRVKEGLESAVPGIVVAVNPDKPRRGCFEIREENGQVFVSLLNECRGDYTTLQLEQMKINLSYLGLVECFHLSKTKEYATTIHPDEKARHGCSG